MSETVLNRLSGVLDRAADYDSNAVAAPIAVLWADEERQWASLIPELRVRHRIVSYGAFDPTAGQGPAYWLRCVIAATVEPEGTIDGLPIVYLPGVSRESLRALDELTPELSPLGALQHRCQWFSHPNGKEWTVKALLSNKEKGLGLDIASGGATATAVVASLAALAHQPWARLESKHIDADFLNDLLSPDPVRSLLTWLDDSTAMRRDLDDGAWSAFVQQCSQLFSFDPASGEIEGARLMGEAQGKWEQVWQRFSENPTDYPQMPERLRAARPEGFFPKHITAWPQDNEAAEDQLSKSLLDLAALTPDGARKELLAFDKEHRSRRGSVWAQLGKAPLANALEYLAEMASVTTSSVPGQSVEEIAEWYATSGWSADLAVLRALNEVREKSDLAAVTAAVTAAYQPWLDSTARLLQAAVGPEANAGRYIATPAPTPSSGEVVMFIDGLRLDVAHLLADRLQGAGLETDIAHALAALPTVTQTSKPVLVPIDQSRLAAGSGLDASRVPDGRSASVEVLRALMADEEIQVMMGDETGDPSGTAWTETGKVDSRGHELGAELVHEIDEQVRRIATRVRELIDAGWTRVTVVTDHGWLLLPGGLPKNGDLPLAVTEMKKGRCARVKPGADLSLPTVPWHWDQDVRIALAPGISCFTANQTYEHGGVSPQECVVPRLVVSGSAGARSALTLTDFRWRGLSLRVAFEELPTGAKVDLRTVAGDATTSIAERAKLTAQPGQFLLLVDDDLEGEQAQLVVVGADESILFQRATTVGQNR